MRLIDLAALPEEGTSHDASIRKRVVLRKGDLPSVVQLARAVLQPGQVVEPHRHASMIEVFMVTSGTGTIRAGDQSHALKRDLCVVVEAGEIHGVSNTGSRPLVLTYFGLEVPSPPTS